MKFRCSQVFSVVLVVDFALTVGISCAVQAQQVPPTAAANPSVSAALGDLQSQVQELKQMVLQLQQETTASRAEISKLRQELQVRNESYAASAKLGSRRRASGTASGGRPTIAL